MAIHPNPKGLTQDILRRPTKRRQKSKVPCSIEGCGKPVIARGWCPMHYDRWRRAGSTDPFRAPTESCAVEGCQKVPRSTYAKYCEMHYGRLRRKGSVAPPRRAPDVCTVDGCDKPGRYVSGLCRMHHLRLKVRGDLNFEFRAEGHAYWTGANASYAAVHQRLKVQRGRASQYDCVDCGSTARHWSYDHSDPSGRIDESCGAYSADLSRYHPRCVSCHKKFDLRRATADRSES